MDAGFNGGPRARRRGTRWAALAVAVAAGVGSTASAAAAAQSAAGRDGGDGSDSTVAVIVEGSAAAAAAEIDRLGGVVHERIGILDGLTATVPAAGLDALSAVPGVRSVTRDGALQTLGDLWGDDTTQQGLLATLLFGSWRADGDKNSAWSIERQTGAQAVWKMSDPNRRGGRLTGAGVGVALIDTGVAPVAGLDAAGKVIDGPDLSFDSQSGRTQHVDGFGHGTHMAALIAGRDTCVLSLLFGCDPADPRNFSGMAPDAKIVNVKAGAVDGSVDVSQVIAGIDWVVQNKEAHNIRVLNLSYGTGSTQGAGLDPLAHAVENAWRAGIVVVVAAGNDGDQGPHPLDMPAIDPFVIAVGSADNNGSADPRRWAQGSWTNSGDADRVPDLLAPGKSVVSLRVPGSAVDNAYPEGRVHGDRSGRYFRGSGTSMSTAVVSGAVALLVQAKPSLTPDQVKGLLMATADTLGGSSQPVAVGGLDIDEAVGRATSRYVPVPAYTQDHPRSTGLGRLEDARGGSHVTDPTTGTELRGEQDIFGVAWDAPSWAAASAAGSAWDGGRWRGTQWTGTGSRPAALAWSTSAWTGIPWLDRLWVRNHLASDLLSPSGVSWHGSDDWSRVSWRGDDWKRVSWRSGGW